MYINCLHNVVFNCSYSGALLRGAVGWCAVCDCGICRSYSLTFHKTCLQYENYM